eukprot:m.312686 g.312686  ORF g.312686 m.312686 type:complete len:132 (+) comp19660_c1_seq3:1705-2100(+)
MCLPTAAGADAFSYTHLRLSRPLQHVTPVEPSPADVTAAMAAPHPWPKCAVTTAPQLATVGMSAYIDRPVGTAALHVAVYPTPPSTKTLADTQQVADCTAGNLHPLHHCGCSRESSSTCPTMAAHWLTLRR